MGKTPGAPRLTGGAGPATLPVSVLPVDRKQHGRFMARKTSPPRPQPGRKLRFAVPFCVFFPAPLVLKPGEPGNRENHVTTRVRGLPVLKIRGIPKPGNRENRTSPSFGGKLPRMDQLRPLACLICSNKSITAGTSCSFACTGMDVPLLNDKSICTIFTGAFIGIASGTGAPAR